MHGSEDEGQAKFPIPIDSTPGQFRSSSAEVGPCLLSTADSSLY